MKLETTKNSENVKKLKLICLKLQMVRAIILVSQSGFKESFSSKKQFLLFSS